MAKYSAMKKEDVKEFLKERASKYQMIDIDEWEKSFYIKPLSATKAMELQSIVTDPDTNKLEINNTTKNLIVLYELLKYSLVDEDGNELYTIDEIMKLTENQFVVISRIADAIYKINGMTTESMEKVRQDFLSTK